MSNLIISSFGGGVGMPGPRGPSGILPKTPSGNYDADGKTISNIAEPINPTDVLRKVDMDLYYEVRDKMMAIATTAEAEAMVNDTKAMTPQKTFIAMNKRLSQGIATINTNIVNCNSLSSSGTGILVGKDMYKSEEIEANRYVTKGEAEGLIPSENMNPVFDSITLPNTGDTIPIYTSIYPTDVQSRTLRCDNLAMMSGGEYTNKGISTWCPIYTTDERTDGSELLTRDQVNTEIDTNVFRQVKYITGYASGTSLDGTNNHTDVYLNAMFGTGMDDRTKVIEFSVFVDNVGVNYSVQPHDLDGNGVPYFRARLYYYSIRLYWDTVDVLDKPYRVYVKYQV